MTPLKKINVYLYDSLLCALLLVYLICFYFLFFSEVIMKKALLLLSILLIFLLGACKVTVSPGLFTDFSSPSPTEKPADSELPTLAPPAPTLEESPEATELPSPSATEEKSAGLLGEVQGDTYVNEALGFTAKIPEGWQVATQEEMDALYGISTEYTEETTGLKANSQAYIFYCSKYGIGNEAINPNVNITLSNQSDMLSVVESEDAFYAFLEAYRPIISNLYGGSDVELTGDIAVTINGKEYSVIHISGEMNGTHLWQDQYFTGTGDYAIIITETYYNEQDGITTDALISSVLFN
jgi:hypothetical protein